MDCQCNTKTLQHASPRIGLKRQLYITIEVRLEINLAAHAMNFSLNVFQ